MHWGLEDWMDMAYPSIHSGVSQVIGAQFLVSHLFLLGSTLDGFMSYTSGGDSARRCTSSTGISDWIFPFGNITCCVTVRCDCIAVTAVLLILRDANAVNVGCYGALAFRLYRTPTKQGTSAVLRPLAAAQRHYHDRYSPVTQRPFHWLRKP